MTSSGQALGLSCVLLIAQTLKAQPVINEILFNPPGEDIPHEYVELRGTPNQPLGKDIFLVAIEGDSGGNPGTVQNVFNLSDLSFGGNGFLVIVQKTNSYAPDSAARILVQTDEEEGFGSGSDSTANHRGESDRTDLENGSTTFFLIHSTDKPSPGDDIDEDDNGVPEGDLYEAWDVLDSIGILDNDGLGDISYGELTFRRNPGAMVSGQAVDIGFTPDYLGRIGNSTGSAPGDWVAAGNLEGDVPDLELGDETDTEPSVWSGVLLDHLGSPNFGAPSFAGLVLQPNDGTLSVGESGDTTSYELSLNTPPAGLITLALETAEQIEISLSAGIGFTNLLTVALDSQAPAIIYVRGIPDQVVEPNPDEQTISHTIIASEDPPQYPVTPETLEMSVQVLDDDWALLSEMKINPPGPEDSPYEFFEIRGFPGLSFDRVYLVTVEGDIGADPGVANVVVDLSGASLGSNGLLLMTASTNPYAPAAATTLLTVPQLDTPGGGLANGSTSILLLSSPEPIIEGEDLDKGDNGVLEGLPDNAFLLDAVGWTDGSDDDLVFGGVDISQEEGTPDAATRFDQNTTPLSKEAWFAGNILGDTPDGLVYDPRRSSTNFPGGTPLSPGDINQLSPYVSPLPAFSGVIDDPTNPMLPFEVDDPTTGPGGLTLSAFSDNPAVVPTENLTIMEGPGGQRFLALEPVGIGYANITVTADNGELTGLSIFVYAASEPGLPSSRFHTMTTDASTAIPIPPDLMLIGDDENQVLRLYPRHVSGKPVNEYNMEPFLELTDFEDGIPREVDIEASDRVGDRIYWVGSHSHANIGEIRTNRAKIFATDIVEDGTNTTVTFVGRYDHLKDDLVNWDIQNLHGKGANYFGLAESARDGVLPKNPRGAGFNIEGFVMEPGSTNTGWLCFRAPIVPATNRLYALIVPVTNYDTASISEGPPGQATFGEPIELDLQGRGIRSIDGDTNGLLIISGPPGDIPTPFPPHDFKIYTWSGDPMDRPQQHPVDLTGLNPEAIVEIPEHPWTEDSQFQFFSDNGRWLYYNDGIQGKFLPDDPHKKFRSDVVTLGPVVKPQPFFTSLEFNGEETILTWRSNPGDLYRIQYKQSLADPSWTNLSGDILAAGPLATKTDMTVGETQRFYQVVLLP